MAERQCYNLIKCCLRGVAKQRVVTFITSYSCNAGKKKLSVSRLLALEFD